MIILIVFVILIITLIIIVVFKLTKKTPKVNIAGFLDQVKIFGNFSNPENIPNDPRSVCLPYQSQTRNKQILDTLTPLTSQCVDVTMLPAIKQQRTCLSGTCITFDGTQINQGDTEIFYDDCQLPSCDYTVGNISIAFSPLNSTNLCLSQITNLVPGPNNLPLPSPTLSPCDKNDINQQLKIRRFNPTTLAANANGQYATIEFNNGTCLFQESGVVTVDTCKNTKDPYWLLIPGEDQQYISQLNNTNHPDIGKKVNFPSFVLKNSPDVISFDGPTVYGANPVTKPIANAAPQNSNTQILDYLLFEIKSTTFGFPYYQWT